MKACDDLGFSGIKTPVSIKDIPKIEKDFDITINIFGHDEIGQIFPIYITKANVNNNKHVNLLTTSEEKESKINNHYVLIKDFNRFCFNQTKSGHRQHNRYDVCTAFY